LKINLSACKIERSDQLFTWDSSEETVGPHEQIT